MALSLPPIPQDPIGENFKWRDWFRRLSGVVSSSSGSFSSNTTQSAAAVNTPQKVQIGITDEANNITLNNSQINVTQAGTYNVQFSVQVTNSSSQHADVDIWFRKGNATSNSSAVDIANTASVASIVGTHGGQPGYMILAANFFIKCVANDFIEMWWSSNDTNVVLNYLPAITTPFTSPGAPSVIVTLTQVS